MRESGHGADAESLLALDVEMNPKSSNAKRQHATAALMTAFETGEDVAENPSSVNAYDSMGELEELKAKPKGKRWSRPSRGSPSGSR